MISNFKVFLCTDVTCVAPVFLFVWWDILSFKQNSLKIFCHLFLLEIFYRIDFFQLFQKLWWMTDKWPKKGQCHPEGIHTFCQQVITTPSTNRAYAVPAPPLGELVGGCLGHWAIGVSKNSKNTIVWFRKWWRRTIKSKLTWCKWMEHTFTQFMRTWGPALFQVCCRGAKIFPNNFNFSHARQAMCCQSQKIMPCSAGHTYQVNCKIVRLSGLFISLFFLAVPLLPRVGLCRNLH